MSAKRNLYLDRDGKRAFLVPPEHELPPGDLTVLGLDGRARQVDGTALAPFEVDPREARAHVHERVQDLASRFKSPPAPSPGNGRGLGRSPRRLARSLRRLVGGFRALLRGVVSEEPEVRSSARGEVRQLRAWLAERGIETDEGLEWLPDLLRAQYRVEGELGRLRESAAALDPVGEDLETSLEDVAAGRRLRALRRAVQSGGEPETPLEVPVMKF